MQKEGYKIAYIDVNDNGFENHGAYSSNPYIEGLIPFDLDQNLRPSPFLSPGESLMNSFISSASFHPNEKGANVYTEKVQEFIDLTETYTFEGAIKKQKSLSYNFDKKYDQAKENFKNIVDTAKEVSEAINELKDEAFHVIGEIILTILTMIGIYIGLKVLYMFFQIFG